MTKTINFFWAMTICGTLSAQTITTILLDGLIISKTRYDSLKLERASIVKIRSKAPTEAVSSYGSRASNGVAIITTSKMLVIKPRVGAVQSAGDQQQKESMLSPVLESQIWKMRNVDAQTLRREFQLDNASGGIVVYLRE